MSADNMIAVISVSKKLYVVTHITWPVLENLTAEDLAELKPYKFNRVMKKAHKLFMKYQPEYGIRLVQLYNTNNGDISK